MFAFKAPERYYELWRRSIEEPADFWNEHAEKAMGDIYWFKKWDKTFEWSYPSFKWYVGGLTNASYNCVDYKVSRYHDKVAYIHEAPELGISRKITYGELYKKVKRWSAALRNLGVQKGDRILLYIPNSIEAITMIHAACRIGAIPCAVFAGFSPGAVADRMELTRPKVIMTQDITVRRGKEIRLKEMLYEAFKLCPSEIVKQIEHVIINRVSDTELTLTKNDSLLEEFEEEGEWGDEGYIPLEANEPLFILCTSGTTAKPKPTVHVHGGFQIWTYWTAKWVYGLNPQDVLFNTTDIGWIVGHSYITFAPLLTGCTAIIYEGVPDYPKPDQWWEVMEKHKATIAWISPTGVRILRKLGIEHAERHDLNSLQRIVCAGEVLNPEVLFWIRDEVFKGRIPVIDHMWQTEVAGAMFGYPYGVELPEIRPGSAGFPMPGVIPEIFDEIRGEPCKPGEKGILLLKKPVPGMTPMLWNDPERYQREYWEHTFLTSGRYYTGDSAYFDDDGYIWFCGRADEVIKISGHRIGTIEIENAIISHPAVAEAGVCGVPDELRGEVAAAFVVLKPGHQPSEELKNEIIQHVRKTFGPLVVFKGIEFVNMLPKTKSGKIMRRVMKKLWTGETLGDLSTLEAEASVDEIKEAVSKLKRI
ncbi:MAG: AMP-binding protein [Candidatus Bathyarchaeia archaeon]